MLRRDYEHHCAAAAQVFFYYIVLPSAQSVTIAASTLEADHTLRISLTVTDTYNSQTRTDMAMAKIYTKSTDNFQVLIESPANINNHLELYQQNIFYANLTNLASFSNVTLDQITYTWVAQDESKTNLTSS